MNEEAEQQQKRIELLLKNESIRNGPHIEDIVLTTEGTVGVKFGVYPDQQLSPSYASLVANVAEVLQDLDFRYELEWVPQTTWNFLKIKPEASRPS